MNRPLVAMVTGGASGLGLATAKHLAGVGAKVLIADLPSSKGAEIANSIENVQFAAVDVTDEKTISAALSHLTSSMGPLSAVVNCAGIATGGLTYSKRGPLSLEDFSRTINVNLIGSFNVSRLAAQCMALQEPYNDSGERGVLINTASVAAFEGQRGQAAYAASKGGIKSLTIVMARDLAQYGIRSMTIAPGVIETPMVGGMTDKIKEILTASVLFPKRLGKAEEYGSLAHHIITNGYLNGECIRMDGGIRMP